MKQLDIVFDLETTSKDPKAGVITMAAVACDFSKKENPWLTDSEGNTEKFYVRFDLLDMFLSGAVFDRDTQEWWMKQKDEAKDALYSASEPKMINEAMSDFNEWVMGMKAQFGCDYVCIWAQGADFDMPKLKHMYQLAGVKEDDSPFGSDDYDKKKLRFQSTRCARTFCLEEIARIWGNRPETFNATSKEQYGIIQALQTPADCTCYVGAHDAMFDSLRTAWNVWWLMQQREKVMEKK